MDEDHLRQAIAAGRTTRTIAAETGKSQTTVRWWLRHYSISNRRRDKPKNPYCNLCGKPMGANLPNRSNCGSCRTTVRRLVLKMVAVKLLGGKCHRCGWSEHIAAFEFHHRDGRQDKEFQIGGRADRAWAAVKAELEKCDLLCSNCHRIEHSRQNDPYLRLAASGYSGMLAHLLL